MILLGVKLEFISNHTYRDDIGMIYDVSDITMILCKLLPIYCQLQW